MKYIFSLTVTIMLLFSTIRIVAGEKPPADAAPLSEIIKSLEDKGYSPVTDVSIDDDAWEIEAYKDGEERELKVDPVSGQVISDQPED
jgi:hypothetical protein